MDAAITLLVVGVIFAVAAVIVEGWRWSRAKRREDWTVENDSRSSIQ